MTVAYLTHDEVNASRIREMAARLRFELAILDIRQTAPEAERLICDLDSLPPETKNDLLANARFGVNLSALAVHSYHLSAKETRLLRAAGVTVSRRLSARLLSAPVLSSAI